MVSWRANRVVHNLAEISLSFFCQGGLHKVIVLGKIIFYFLTPDISPRQPRRKPPRTRLRTPRGQQGGISDRQDSKYGLSTFCLTLENM